MAILSPNNSFQSWILSPEEFTQGSILTSLQKQCIQNQITQLAEEKLALTLDPTNLHQFLQQEAELQGSIKSLKYLLTLSDQAEAANGTASINL